MSGMIRATALPEVIRSFLDDSVRWGLLCTSEGALMAYASAAAGDDAPYIEKSDAKVAAAMVANVWTDYAEGVGPAKGGAGPSFDGLSQLHIDSEKGQLVVERLSEKLNYLICVCAPHTGDDKVTADVKSLESLRTSLSECFADASDADA